MKGTLKMTKRQLDIHTTFEQCWFPLQVYAASLNFVHEQYFDAHLVDQGIVDTFMRIWPGKVNVVCSAWISIHWLQGWSSFPLLNVCTPTHMDKCLPSIHLFYGEFSWNYMFAPLIADQCSQTSSQLGSLWFGKSWSTRLSYSDPPLTHSLSISSRWILAIVATTWAASITTYVTLFALGSSAYTNGMLSQFAAVLSNTWSSEIRNRFGCPYLCSGSTPEFWCYIMEVGHSLHLTKCFSDDTHDIKGCGKSIFHILVSLLTKAGWCI